MEKYLTASYWLRPLRYPLTWLAMVVDLSPIVFALMNDWGATAFVLLYWAENVIIGVATFFRIIAAGAVKHGLGGFAGALFLAAFFCVHYGMFCFVHGIFIFNFADINVAFLPTDAFKAITSLYQGAGIILVLMALFQLAAIIADYWPSRGKHFVDVKEEMFAPYGRVVVLHLGIFVGVAALMSVGDPTIGVFLLILFRAGFSIIGRAWRESNAG